MIQRTSIESYYGEKKAGRLGERQRAVYELIKENPGHTDRELARILAAADPNTVRPRRYELVEKGLVIDAGKRKCRVTGKVAMTWRTRTGEIQQELF